MSALEIIVIIISILIVSLVTIFSIINKKKGKSSCGCNCQNCSKTCTYKEKNKKCYIKYKKKES